MKAQQQIVQAQDRELDAMAHSLNNLQHINIQINSELKEQQSDLDDLDKEIDMTKESFEALQPKWKRILKGKSMPKIILLILVLCIAILVILIASL
jgi:hypothetical protein